MLGDGTVIFGTAVVTVWRRKLKWSPKIGVSRWTGPVTSVTFGVQVICPSLAVDRQRRAERAPLDPGDRVEEVGVPLLAAELPVGRGPQPDALLQPDRVPDRGVLDGGQRRRVDLPGREVVPRREQPGRPQQRPDVVGAERRRGASCHLALLEVS